MAVYYALAFFSILVGLAIRSSNYSKRKIAVDLLLFALIVLTVSLIIWAPWIGNLTDLSSVVTAIFPIHRGLYQLKVPNFWCISDIIFKW